jgi:hypothetical protein
MAAWFDRPSCEQPPRPSQDGESLVAGQIGGSVDGAATDPRLGVRLDDHVIGSATRHPPARVHRGDAGAVPAGPDAAPRLDPTRRRAPRLGAARRRTARLRSTRLGAAGSAPPVSAPPVRRRRSPRPPWPRRRSRCRRGPPPRGRAAGRGAARGRAPRGRAAGRGAARGRATRGRAAVVAPPEATPPVLASRGHGRIRTTGSARLRTARGLRAPAPSSPPAMSSVQPKVRAAMPRIPANHGVLGRLSFSSTRLLGADPRALSPQTQGVGNQSKKVVRARPTCADRRGFSASLPECGSLKWLDPATAGPRRRSSRLTSPPRSSPPRCSRALG